jgi:hypothetical protein
MNIRRKIMIDQQLLEIVQYTREGYRPVLDYDSWRVAVLNYIDELLPPNITKMQKHQQTDEAFILLKGQCLLYIGEGETEVTHILPQKMESLKVYNVKKNTWHTHTLSKDAMVLIIENRDTTDDNSPEILLTEKQRTDLVQLAEEQASVNLLG